MRGLRAARKHPLIEPLRVGVAGPLNFAGILTPAKRIASSARQRVGVFPELAQDATLPRAV